jgi:type II secretory pathway component PulF
MVYPMIVLCSAFLLSCFLGYLLGTLVWPSLEAITQQVSTSAVKMFLWLSPVLLGVLVMAALVVLAVPTVRRAMRWRMPAFKESSMAQVASAMSLMLRSGVPLDQSLALVERLEQGTRAGTELAAWRKRLAAGHGKISDLAEPGRAFPPLFIWLVARGGDDLAAGFQKAAEIYQARAKHRADMILYSALPVSILALGVMLISQMQPVFQTLVKFMNMIGDAGG